MSASNLPSMLPSNMPVDVAKKRPRGRNFRQTDDERLCKTWLSISQDPIEGNGQKIESFWSRIADLFNEGIPISDPWYRSAASLQSRWSPLQASVSKFCGAYAQVVEEHHSGWNEQMVIDEALKRFTIKDSKGSSFGNLTSWVILKSSPKWKSYSSSLSVGTAQVPSGTQIVAGSEDSETFLTPERPIGNKKAKKESAKASKFDTKLRLNAERNRILAMEATALQDEVSMKFFMQDPDCDESKKYFELKRKQVLRRLQAEMENCD